MYKLEIINELKRRLKTDKAEAVIAFNLAINNTLFEIMAEEEWHFAKKELYFNTVAPYATGSITLTKGSTTLSGSGTVFTLAMVGRKVVLTNNNNKSYKISAYVSGTELTLESPYLEDTVTTSVYGIYKDIYKLDGRAMKLYWATQNYTPTKLYEIFKRQFREQYANHGTFGDPIAYCAIGQTTEDYYNTGTVLVTLGDATVTLTTGVFPTDCVGMIFKVVGDDTEYVIKTRTDTTHVELDANYAGTTAATALYAIEPAGTEQIQLYPMPDKVMQVNYEALLRPLKLINDNDTPDIPIQWQNVLMEGSYWRASRTREVSAEAKSAAKEDYYTLLKKMQMWHKLTEDALYDIQTKPQPRINNSNAWCFKE